MVRKASKKKRSTKSISKRQTQNRRAAKTPEPHVIVPNGAPPIRRKRSKLHGWGVFALESINKNKRIIDYAGEKIRNRDSLPREDRYLGRGEIWCFRLNHLYSRDAKVGGNVARFINHACKPNCYSDIIGGTIWIIAGRNIKAGEELTYNYFTEGDGELPCKCRPGCKTML